MREFAIEQQELKNPVSGDIGCVHLAVGFKCRAAAQQTDMLEVLMAGVLAFRRAEQIRLIDLEQRGRCVCALKVAAQPYKLPSLAVNHGCIAYALE